KGLAAHPQLPLESPGFLDTAYTSLIGDIWTCYKVSTPHLFTTHQASFLQWMRGSLNPRD
ncbi:hypothetical protein NDU88_000875, partial [Pleurodeles waltl]